MTDTKTIYIDTLLIINLCIDFLALSAGGKLCGTKPTLRGLILASTVGGTYSVFAAYFDPRGFEGLFLDLAAAVIMCFIAYEVKGIPSLITSLAAFYGANLLIGGGVSFILGRGADNKNAVIIILSAAAVFVSVGLMSEIFSQKRVESDAECTVTMLGISRRVKLLCDSGDLLKDPFSGASVIILSPSVFPEISGLVEEERFEAVAPLHPRVIPTETVGGRSILYGLIPDKVIYHTKGSDRRLDAAVAFGRNDVFGGFDGVIPTSLI